ncbi:hypothetical protein F5984_23965 [Rudanella paleaurantiibacter]|uniref:Uncharacterized protein n=1 Tax=Rudanella paleaurantiibacter TaxID=2614655 RepID=A0A7J5TT28_9BACT|nr:hypothetical protein [Rudanella paleaurantiibacter]KAB7726687.1 hypothetical protein F5984_23965 [Rudanella paleaurantiibacter]
MKRTRFSADYTYTVEGSVIAIVDLDLGNRSVTNDMELVLNEIRAELGDLAGYSVIYRDSMGRWDGVRLVNGVVCFYGLGEADKESALNRLLHLVES